MDVASLCFVECLQVKLLEDHFLSLSILTEITESVIYIIYIYTFVCVCVSFFEIVNYLKHFNSSGSDI